jgi:hypothetical protein
MPCLGCAGCSGDGACVGVDGGRELLVDAAMSPAKYTILALAIPGAVLGILGALGLSRKAGANGRIVARAAYSLDDIAPEETP